MDLQLLKLTAADSGLPLYIKLSAIQGMATVIAKTTDDNTKEVKQFKCTQIMVAFSQSVAVLESAEEIQKLLMDTMKEHMKMMAQAQQGVMPISLPPDLARGRR